MNAALGRSADLDEVSWLVADRCRVLLDARTVVFGLLDADELVMIAVSGFGAARARGARVAREESFAGEAMRTGDVSRPDSETHAEATGIEPWSASLVASMQFAGEAVGCLGAFRFREPDQGFGAVDEQMLRSLAATASVALATVRLAGHGAVRRSVAATERDRVEWAGELQDESLQQLAVIRMLIAAAGRSGDERERAATLKEPRRSSRRRSTDSGVP